jgi:hypothetical protein
MGRPITLFVDYKAKENLVTNYCGLILKILYEENPKSFQEVISTFISSDFNVLPEFTQQSRKGESIPDLIIQQKSYSLRFETKLNDDFTVDQISAHLSNFPTDINYRILFLLSSFPNENQEDTYNKFNNLAKDAGVELLVISFEDLVDALSNVEISESFQSLLEEFKIYLDRIYCIPSWKYLLDVVNCSSTIDEVYDHSVYICPNTGGQYSHQRAKYFGGYKDKEVKYLQRIIAIVEVQSYYNEKDLPEEQIVKKTGLILGTQKRNLFSRIVYNNEGKIEDNLENALLKFIKVNDLNRFKNLDKEGYLVFLLTEINKGKDAEFIKMSSGGMFGNKKYFRNIAKGLNPNDEVELTKKIKSNKLNWSNWDTKEI